MKNIENRCITQHTQPEKLMVPRPVAGDVAYKDITAERSLNMEDRFENMREFSTETESGNTEYEQYTVNDQAEENGSESRTEYEQCEEQSIPSVVAAAEDDADPDSRKKTKRKKTRSGRSFGKMTVVLALCCALIGGIIGAGTAVLTTGTKSSTTILTGSRSSDGTSSTATDTTSTVDTGEELTASEVYAQNVNSTVGITTSTTTNYFGYETTSAASGSGFIITSDGYIVTNYHVVEDSDEITVSTYDGTSYEAELVGYDENNDVAVLKIDAEGLTPVVLGDSDTLSVGDEVVAIGNPLGELTFSLTSGVVSALNRSVTLSTNVTMNLIQTDCAINSGNSGGALFNMYGEVIGITNAKYSSSSSSSSASIDNIGFAIPINQVKDIITSIIETGTVEKTYIGVTVSDITTEAAASSGISSGALVQSVTEGAPADEAGLEAGDIITEINGTAVSGSSELVAEVQKLSEGDEAVLIVYRDGETLEITVTVGTQTTSALPDEEDSEDEDSYSYYYGYGNGSPSDSWGDDDSQYSYSDPIV